MILNPGMQQTPFIFFRTARAEERLCKKHGIYIDFEAMYATNIAFTMILKPGM